ncbi:MAG: M23 family metallopeptidase, partial [Muribaculaceae bacterium]|nr:M23 family metallopeptidase [Muribaculaceae bacterium]
PYRIVSAFGRTDHPRIPGVQIQNSGIDIEAGTKDAGARAVYEGTVSSVFRIDGYQNIVIVRHGEYLTVYAGLDNIAVRKGDKVRAGQALGHIYRDPDDGGRAVLHFELRHEKEKLNPSEWVKP